MSGLLELAERHRDDLLALDDARTGTIYGGLFDAFSAEDYSALRAAGLIRSYIPAGCMAPLTKLTPKGQKIVTELREMMDDDPLMPRLTGRANYLAGKGEVKTPELLREAAAALRARAAK